MSHTEGSTLPIEDRQNDSPQQSPELSQADSAFVQARQRRKIAELEGKLESLESGRARKERYVPALDVLSYFCSLHEFRQMNYYLAQGRGFRRVVALFDGIEDLVAENDRRYDDQDEDATLE